jgi:hypothetical protein
MRQLFQKFIYLIVLTSIVIGCSSKKSSDRDELIFGSKDYADAFVSQLNARWFKTLKRFTHTNSKNEVLANRFFDVSPINDIKKKTLNIIVTTPEDSLYHNGLNISSGQIYVDKKFCPQEDEYNQYSSKVFKPPFSIGVVPRVLDQLNKPQKIIVFGGKNYFKKYYLTHYFDVRLVGGYIEQLCPRGGCLNSDEWKSRLVLIAVQNGHEKYNHVQNLTDLKIMHDWDYIKAFVQNGMGKNKIADKYYASYRMGAEVTSGQAISFLKENSTIFSLQKLQSMRLSCYKLYDFLWKDLSYVSANEREAVTKEEIRKKAIAIRDSRGRYRLEKPFNKRFMKDFKQFGEQYKTCSKYIKPTNINTDPKRHWFFAYLSAFHKLHDLGYAFNCKADSWQRNPLLSGGKRMISLEEQFSSCSNMDIDKSMSSAIRMLDTLRKNQRRSYRYVDYDKGSVGTHQKLYSWVESDGKVNSCSDLSESGFSSRRAIFPSDIFWKKRGSAQRTSTKMGDIIY